MNTTTLEEMLDRHVGKIGTEKRDEFEYELKMDLLGEAIKRTRKKRNLTQTQLGKASTWHRGASAATSAAMASSSR